MRGHIQFDAASFYLLPHQPLDMLLGNYLLIRRQESHYTNITWSLFFSSSRNKSSKKLYWTIRRKTRILILFINKSREFRFLNSKDYRKLSSLLYHINLMCVIDLMYSYMWFFCCKDIGKPKIKVLQYVIYKLWTHLMPKIHTAQPVFATNYKLLWYFAKLLLDKIFKYYSFRKGRNTMGFSNSHSQITDKTQDANTQWIYTIVFNFTMIPIPFN